MTLAVRYAARSDVGLLREGNEDSAYASPRLLAIADGMGGHVAGEVASSVVIATIARLDADPPGPDPLAALADATRSANASLRERMRADTRLDGMGTTLTAMLIDGARGGLVHIGDSRGYLLRDGRLEPITRDHSLVQTLVDEGRLTAEQAVNHPQRALILRALDGSDATPDLSVRELQLGDRYLLCSDGLTDVVTDATIERTLAAADDPAAACDALVELALRAGGPDNITCVVADVVEGEGSAEIIFGGAAAEQDVVAGSAPDTPAGRAALATRGGSATAPAPRTPPPPVPPPSGEEHPPPPPQAYDEERAAGRRRRAARVVAWVVAIVVVIAAAIGGAWAYVRAQYYVGVWRSQVVVYQGVQGSVVGIALASVRERSGIPVASLPAWEQPKVSAGIDASSLTDARRIVDQLRAEQATSTGTGS